MNAAIGAALLFAMTAAEARAQRGADFIDQSRADRGPRAGFPGIFDTTTVRAGDSLVSLPALGVDYGVSDDLSVGSNGLLLVPNIGLQPSLFGRARYRFHASARWRAVIDAAGGVVRASFEDEGTVFANALMFGSNVSRRLSPLHTITGSVLAFRLGLDADDGTAASQVSTSFAGAVVAVTHELTPADWFSLRTSLVFVPAIRGAVDEIGSTITVEVGGTQALLQRNGARVLASFRAGRRWLITAGGMLVAFPPHGIPWLSVAKIF